MTKRIAMVLAGLIALPCGLIMSSQQAWADNWPRFRGPNGTGVAADKDVPIQWSDKENVLWKTAIPGLGNSSPVIWGDHVFLQSSSKDGKERMLFCLNAGDGRILWSRNVPGVPFKALHKRSSHASSTSKRDGERIYVNFWDGLGQSIHAFDFKGTPLWQHQLGEFSSQHGAGASPIIYDGKLYINNDQDGSAAIVCLDAKTGKEIWEAKRTAFRACYSVPFILERPGEPTALVVGSSAGLTGYDPQTGKELCEYKWSFTGMALRTIASPQYHDGLIVLSGGDGNGSRDTIAVEFKGKGDLSEKSLAWRSQNRAILPYVPTMLWKGEHLYFVNDSGIAHCVQAKTGKVIWKERLGAGTSASPILVDGKIYSVSETGEVHVFAADPAEFKLLAKSELGETVFASPAVADNRLYIRSAAHLYCIAKTSKK